MPNVTKTDSGDYSIDGSIIPASSVNDQTRAQLDAAAAASTTLPAAAQYTGPASPGPTQYLEPIYLPRTDSAMGGRTLAAPSMTYQGEPMSAPGMNEPPVSAAPAATVAPQAQAQQRSAQQQTGLQPQFGAGMPGLGGSSMAVQTTIEKAPKLSKSDEAAIVGAAQKQSDAEVKIAEAKAASAAKLSDLNQFEAMRQGFANAAAEESEKARQSEISAQQADVLQSVKDLEGKKIDPNRSWKNKNAGQKVGSIIGLMLGTFGAALTKGPNYAMQMLDKESDDDIDAQKQEIAKTKDLIGLKNNGIAQLMARGASERQAEAATRINRYEQFQTMVRAQALKSDSEVVRAEAEKAVAAIEQKKAAELANLHLATQDRVQIQMAPNAGMSRQQQEYNALLVGLPGGGTAIASSESDAKEMKTQSAAVMTVQNLTNELEKFTEVSGKSLSPEMRIKIAGTVNGLVTALGAASNAGTMQQGEVDRYKKIIGNPADWTTLDSTVLAGARHLREMAQAQFLANLEARRMLPK